MAEITKVEHERLWFEVWQREHPGKTIKDYRRVPAAEMREWRIAHNARAYAAERRAWKREHGTPMPDEHCGMSLKDANALQRWRKRRRARR